MGGVDAVGDEFEFHLLEIPYRELRTISCIVMPYRELRTISSAS